MRAVGAESDMFKVIQRISVAIAKSESKPKSESPQPKCFQILAVKLAHRAALAADASTNRGIDCVWAGPERGNRRRVKPRSSHNRVTHVSS